MKTALFALFLLLAFSSKLAWATALVDIDGKPVRNGGQYYILPVFRRRGGGFGLARTGNETCPLTVAQAPSEVSDGSGVIISSPFKIAYITTGLVLELSFVAVPNCAPTPSKWTVVEELPEGWGVKITGYENTVGGWFRIEKYGTYATDYNLAFCPSSTASCSALGIEIDEEGIRRLVVATSGNPFVVNFKKADALSFA